MDAKTILKYKEYSLAQLKAKAQKVFNAWIRKRDEGKPCVNCGRYTKLQAGHFYPTSTHSILRFNEDACHGECLHCNFYNSQSHAYGYAKEIVKRIGAERFEKLEAIATKRAGFIWDRFSLIGIIEKYK